MRQVPAQVTDWERVVEPAAPPLTTPVRPGGDPPTAAELARLNGDPGPGLLGRRREAEALQRVLDAACSGHSRVLVLRGEPGIGKSVLLEHLATSALGCRVARAAGVESEMELPYAGLHQLCTGMLALTEQLPPPQRDAMATVFGQSAGPAPDQFLVGLATLTLIAITADQQPLVCIVDDAHWLDHASAQILGFVARRLLAERVAIVCAARTGVGDDVLAGLPELPVRGLRDCDARALLLDSRHGSFDAAVCDQIVAESRGNPLALLELPRTWDATDLAGGFGHPSSEPVAGKIQRSYSLRLAELPPEAQLLVLAAAADPVGDPMLLDRAAATLGLNTAAIYPAVDAGLVKVGARITFAHPLLRSAVYHAATSDQRQLVHSALAEATDAETDPDRRAWHRAQAASGPDELIASELDRSATRAQARGGFAAAAGFLRRAVMLSSDPARRVERALAAAQACMDGGAFSAAVTALGTAEDGPLDDFQRARVDLVRAHVAFASDLGSDAPVLLLQAARRLEPFDRALARETYLAAWGAANIAGHHTAGDVRLEICRSILALPRPDGDPRPLDLLVDGLALLATDGHGAAVAPLQQATRALTNIPVEDVLRWGWVATDASCLVWDLEGMLAMSTRHVQLVRRAGALAQLPLHLWQLGVATAGFGDLAGASSLAAETSSVAEATGTQMAPYPALRLAALRGREAECSALVADTIERARSRGQGTAVIHAQWAAAVLYNGLGRYEEAEAAGRVAVLGYPLLSLTTPCAVWALPELIEAAVRAGDRELAQSATQRLRETTRPCGTDVALGIEARCEALLVEAAAAEDLYREALERLSRTGLRPELARAHLLYGEWLRRRDRRIDAREQLRTAHHMLDDMDMQAFAERARRELMATGERARKRTNDTRTNLTPQEQHIAGLARDGLSNSEIGAQLFVSARTIEWHLSHVYAKLGIRSRKELHNALAAD